MDVTKEIDKERIIELVGKFCDIILTENDKLSLESASNYIETLSDDDKRFLEFLKKDDVDFIVRDKLMTYIQSYQKEDFFEQQLGTPFEFDIEDKFDTYIDEFIKLYLKKCSKKDIFPIVLQEAFSAIKEMSEHYQIFERFYKIRSHETGYEVLHTTEGYVKKQAEIISKQSAEFFTREAIANAEEKFEESISAKISEQNTELQKSLETAKEEISTHAYKDVEDKVKNKMLQVTEKVSETSVTILGIFSGIVLTVVAGLFYSSSVIENINTANFEKLVCIAALVGLICINLIAIMFHYINRIRTNSWSVSIDSEALILSIDVILLIIVLLFGALVVTNKSNTVKQTIGSETEYDQSIRMEIKYKKQ